MKEELSFGTDSYRGAGIGSAARPIHTGDIRFGAGSTRHQLAGRSRVFAGAVYTVIVLTLALACSTCANGVENPDNQLPIGTVDTPAANAILEQGPIVVGGWAADDSKVSEVRIFADGFFRTKTTVSVPRPDVAHAFPAYHTTGDMFGWNVSLDFGFSPGVHTILAQAVDDSGATKDIGTVVVTMPR